MKRFLLLLLASCLGAAGCKQEEPPPIIVTAEEARAARLACTFAAGATPAETLHTDAPHGDAIPIDHILLVMQENRSFDHYYSNLTHGDVVVAAPDATNPDGTGAPVARFHETRYCVADTPHSWNASHLQWGDGANDGFVVAAEPDGTRALGYYDDSDLPFYYALAREFAISDRHFAALLGPTWPNRMYYFAGTSWGLTGNLLPPAADAEGNLYPNLFNVLADADISWKIYAEDVPSPGMFLKVAITFQSRFRPLDDFFTDIAAGDLPAVSVVEADFIGKGLRNDEHAPGNVQLGQAFTASVIEALMASEHWPRSVLFITYDEHGGFYDSVPPPEACPPDDIPPALDPGDAEGAFDRHGFRVPLIVVSPYAKRGHVSHHVSGLASVLRFVQLRYDLPAFTARDANAEPLLDLFDFDSPDLDIPDLPEALVDQSELDYCAINFPE